MKKTGLTVLDGLRAANRKQRIILDYTKDINQDDVDGDPGWAYLALLYSSAQKDTWEVRASITILNSILHQRRIVFGLTRKSVGELLRNDKNWKKPLGLRNGNYSSLLSTLFLETIEKINYPDDANKLLICKLVNPVILGFLNVDEQKQTAEVLKFVNKKKRKSSKKI